MPISPKQLEAVTALDGPKRYAHFIKRAADEEQVWGLYSEGWALAATDEGQQVFPLWPAAEYAAACASKGWEGYAPRQISVDTLLEDLLPRLEEGGTALGIFPTPLSKGVVRFSEELERDLRAELAQYE